MKFRASGHPQFCDEALADLAAMLTEDVGGVVPRREVLQPQKLDYSVDSLKHLDEYLEALREDPPVGDDLLKAVLRSGAYVGEVIRRHSDTELHWIDYDGAVRESELVKEFGRSPDTLAVLWAGPGRLSFPLAKVSKYLANGAEDSVHFFARGMLGHLRAKS